MKPRSADKKNSAPPDYGEPWYKTTKVPNNLGWKKSSIKTYEIETILKIREDCESYVKPLPIVRIWRRKMKSVVVYRIEQMLSLGEHDESWILPYEIVAIHKRKTRDEVTIDELDQE